MTSVALIGSALSVPDAALANSAHLLRMCGGNTGNFAYVRGLSDVLADSELFGWDCPVEVVRERCDVVVLACANQLGPHTDLGGFAKHLDKIGLPIVAFGLGAQAASFEKAATLTEGTKRWVETLAAHAPSRAPNIGVRGEFSRRALEAMGLADRADITGCPSNFINADPGLGDLLSAKLRAGEFPRIGVAAGLPYWPELQRLEQELADLVGATGGLYVAQHELNMIRLARGEFCDIEAKTMAQLNRYIRPGLSLKDFQLWCRRHAVCFVGAASWMEALRNVDFVVGPRFHGVMLALQAGTPGGVVAHDSRTLEMCQTMRIPVRVPSEVEGRLNASALAELFPFDAEAFARQRETLGRRTVDMLRAAGIATAAKLLALCEAKPGQALEAA